MPKLLIEVAGRSFHQWWRPDLYLDPGSGSYLLQILIAGIMGGLVMLRIYWSKVTGFIRKLFGGAESNDSE